MSEMQIGPICFRNGHGSILAGRFYYDLRDNPHGIVSEPIGFADDDLVVIIRILEPDQAKAAARRLRPGTGLGGVLSAWHFDPPEDHPEEPEFDYLDAVVYDFREINDHLDTLEGVRGPHFTSLLEWQPKIDPARTALFCARYSRNVVKSSLEGTRGSFPPGSDIRRKRIRRGDSYGL